MVLGVDGARILTVFETAPSRGEVVDVLGSTQQLGAASGLCAGHAARVAHVVLVFLVVAV